MAGFDFGIDSGTISAGTDLLNKADEAKKFVDSNKSWIDGVIEANRPKRSESQPTAVAVAPHRPVIPAERVVSFEQDGKRYTATKPKEIGVSAAFSPVPYARGRTSIKTQCITRAAKERIKNLCTITSLNGLSLSGIVDGPNGPEFQFTTKDIPGTTINPCKLLLLPECPSSVQDVAVEEAVKSGGGAPATTTTTAVPTFPTTWVLLGVAAAAGLAYVCWPRGKK
jgi:hypothetical protein